MQSGVKEKMKKIICIIASIAFAILLSSSFAYAHHGSDPEPDLVISVTVGNSVINPNDIQQIIATTNKNGYGVLFVVQPATGGSLESFLNHNWLIKGLYESLSSELKAELQGKIVSYLFFQIDDSNGGTRNFNFPTDFHGINGDASTALGGTYKVVFAFLSGSWFCGVDYAFDCNSWFVVPESPIGTAMAIAAPMVAVGTITLLRKRKKN